MHDGLGHEVSNGFIYDATVRIHKVTDGFHLPFQLRVHRERVCRGSFIILYLTHARTHTQTHTHTLLIRAAGGSFEAVTNCPASREYPWRAFSVGLFDAGLVINSDKSFSSSLLMCSQHAHTHINTPSKSFLTDNRRVWGYKECVNSVNALIEKYFQNVHGESVGALQNCEVFGDFVRQHKQNTFFCRH